MKINILMVSVLALGVAHAALALPGPIPPVADHEFRPVPPITTSAGGAGVAAQDMCTGTAYTPAPAPIRQIDLGLSQVEAANLRLASCEIHLIMGGSRQSFYDEENGVFGDCWEAWGRCLARVRAVQAQP